MNKVKFSIIGTGYFVKVFDKTHPLYEKLKSQKDSRVLQKLNDCGVWERLGFRDDSGYLYSNFYDVKPSKVYTAYAVDGFTRLEIKGVKHKPIKLFFKDLLVNYLFPPSFIVRESTFVNEGLVVIELDKGFFGKAISLSQFTIEDVLSFDMISIPELNVRAVKAIKVNDNEISLKHSDTLNFGVYSFIV